MSISPKKEWNSSNKSLRKASKTKNDEFYTQLSDIERELSHYKEYFRDKTVFCNCDDPRVSNFFHYFSYNFEKLWLKRLITTCYKNKNINMFSDNSSTEAIYLEYYWDMDGDKTPSISEIWIKPLRWDGDFRSIECINLLKEADIVVTNPPFSLFREYISQLQEYKKDFLIIGNLNALTYKDIFKLIRENKIWLWHTSPKEFLQIDKTTKKFWNVCWFTNLETQKRHEDMILYRAYDPWDYPRYDHYDAINIDRTKDIPKDYPWYMGVPITFLDKHNPEQFEIIDGLNRYSILDGPTPETRGKYLAQVHGKPTYIRIIIRNKKP